MNNTELLQQNAQVFCIATSIFIAWLAGFCTTNRYPNGVTYCFSALIAASSALIAFSALCALVCTALFYQ